MRRRKRGTGAAKLQALGEAAGGPAHMRTPDGAGAHMRCIIGPAPPPPRTTPGRLPTTTPALSASVSRSGGCAWALGTSEAAGHRRQHADSAPCSTPAGAIAPRSRPRSPSSPPHPHNVKASKALPNYASLCPQGRKPHAASPRVLELNEGEGRSPAAVLQVDVADGAVFVKHVLNVLGSDVWR